MRQRILPSLFLMSALVAVGCGNEPKSPPPSTSNSPASFSWPTMDGWRKETIPFPLSFAPALPHKGVEEIRFAPKFFDPKSDTYFTYSFAFILDEERALPPEQLSSELGTYFTGLMTNVGKKPAPSSASISGTSEHFTGHVKTFDAFKAKQDIELNVEGDSFVCKGHRIVIASLSPHPAKDPVWKTLADVRKSFTCD